MNWVQIVGVLIGNGLLTTVIGWLTVRRLNAANAKKAEAESAKIYSEIYSKLVQDLTNQINTLKNYADGLEKELKTIRTLANRLIKRLQKYEDVNEQL